MPVTQLIVHHVINRISKSPMDEYKANEYVMETSSKPLGKDWTQQNGYVLYKFTAEDKVMIKDASTYELIIMVVLLSLISRYSTYQ